MNNNLEEEAESLIEDFDDQGEEVEEEGEDQALDDSSDLENEEADEPNAEGETPESSYLHPSYDNANSIEFHNIVSRLEWISNKCKSMHRKKKKPRPVDILEKLLPRKILDAVTTKQGDGGLPQSLYPLLRLLMGQKDTARQFKLKHTMLANMYVQALGLSPKHDTAMTLLNYTDPRYNHIAPGDFVTTLFGCLEHKISDDGDDCISPVTGKKERITIGAINEKLDELASIAQKSRRSLHMGTESAVAESNLGSPTSKIIKDAKVSPGKRRALWLSSLIKNQRLTRVEHKWLAAIILDELKISVSAKRIMKHVHPYFSDLYDSHNSLKAVCDLSCQDFVDKVRNEDPDMAPASFVAPYLLEGAHVEFGSPFTPMCSKKTGFDRLLLDISKRHRDNAPEINEVYGNSPLITHPAFCIETKLDGERMVIHYRRDGVLKIHSRRAVFYSDYYAPSLGPAMRKAVGKHNFDLIFDGEIVAWDNHRKETIPFGNNRTIANLRRRWLERHRTVDSRDLRIHDREPGLRTKDPVFDGFQVDISEIEESAGEECWLQYQIFDLLYIDGPGAVDFVNATVSSNIHFPRGPGSIVGIDLMERKKLLYRLVDPVSNEVEIVSTLVIRSNGEKCSGEEYFSSPTISQMDCLSDLFKKSFNEIEEQAIEVRADRSDEDISAARANRVDKHYKHIVEKQRMEGLLFKDLATPYHIGEISRGLGYWMKFKPDYFNGSVASDLDLLVVGAYYATGLRLAGRPSSLLCACVDSTLLDAKDAKFFTVCKVSASSLVSQDYERLLNLTKYDAPRGGHTLQIGNWYSLVYPELPEFVSPHSHQNGRREQGWKVAKNEYPDMWINPENSIVVTLNAGEIVPSELFSCGLTLRFPRITRLRVDGNSKHPSQIESDTDLWNIYSDFVADREKYSQTAPLSPGIENGQIALGPCRFLTESQSRKRTIHRNTRKRTLGVLVSNKVEMVKSRALDGLSFTVLSGRYSLGRKRLNSVSDKGKEASWVQVASAVRSKGDVESFLVSHGASVSVQGGSITVGGEHDDPKVISTTRDREVIRWTFFYSLVDEWLEEGKSDLSILKEDPQRLQPDLCDYFVSEGRCSKLHH